MRSMTIDTTRLGEEPSELQLELTGDWLARELDGVIHPDGHPEGEVTLSLTRLGAQVQVSGHLSARFAVACGRCLEPAEVVVDEPFFMVFEFQEDAGALPEELELTEEDLHWASFDGREIDLAPLIREQLILAVPMKPLCRPNCLGMGLGDGAGGDGPPEVDEKPADPRWNALAKLK